MLLTLPTELVLHIITQPRTLKPTDIYHLCQTCRTLKRIALPIFLSSCGIYSTTHISLHIPRWNPSSLRAPDPLMGLYLADYITQIDVLKCFFQDPHLTTTRNVSQKAEDLTYAIERLCRFIQRVKVVKNAVISLVWDPYYIAPNSSFIPVDKLNAWSTHFSTLLNCLVERKCETLTVQYRSMFEPAFQFRNAGWMKKKFSSITRQGGAFVHATKEKEHPRLAWEYDLPAHLHIEDEDPTRLITHPFLSPLAQEVNWMTVLRIHSDVLIRPPILPWTLNLLRNSQHIAELSFAHVLCSNEEWRVVLTAIREIMGKRLFILMFGVECPGLEAGTIVEFLGHLLNLTHLSISKSFSRAFRELVEEGRSRPHLDFPQMKVLIAPLDFAQLALRYQYPKRRRQSSLDPVSRSPTRHAGPSRPHQLPVAPLTKPPCPVLSKLTIYPTGFGQNSSESSDSLRSHFQSCREISDFVKHVIDQGRTYAVYFSLDLRWEVGELREMVERGEANRRDASASAGSGVAFGGLTSPAVPPQESLSASPPSSPISSTSGSSNIQGSELGAYSNISELVMTWSSSRLRDLSPRMLCRWIRLYVPQLRVIKLEGGVLENEGDPNAVEGQVTAEDGVREALLNELRRLNGNVDQRPRDEGWSRMRIQALVIGGRRIALDV
ncbi:hypothetical protein CVT24_012221 [Panaeolus cyanescens]|uniref:F-box domain-containing protein n=1 Tax=Panaeolus cyanescens TaxID=181874 RepID=A0A409VYT0_9AGAR|nr:hypothetical protein CVT24_012221 [Panaeolus cyanescens]